MSAALCCAPGRGVGGRWQRENVIGIIGAIFGSVIGGIKHHRLSVRAVAVFPAAALFRINFRICADAMYAMAGKMNISVDKMGIYGLLENGRCIKPGVVAASRDNCK